MLRKYAYREKRFVLFFNLNGRFWTILNKEVDTRGERHDEIKPGFSSLIFRFIFTAFF